MGSSDLKARNFRTITGISNDVVADILEDTLTLASGNSLLTIVGTSATDTITFTVDPTPAFDSVTLTTPLAVTSGGIGAASLTDHGILLGSGTGTITALGIASNGQIPIGSTGIDPVLATITAGEAIDVTNGAGSITIACEDASDANKGVVELLTDAEIITGSDTTRAATAANITAKIATFLNVSAGAADAGKPVKLDAAGHVDASMINDADIDHGSIAGLGDDDHTQYLLADGTRNLGGNLTQDNGLYIATDEIRARDSGGLALKDDSGTLGMFIEDGGQVGIGTATPSYSLHIEDDSNDPIALISADGDYFPRFLLQRINGSTKTNYSVSLAVNSSGYLNIKTGPALDSLVDRVTIDTNGDIGIGTTGPNARLDIEDNSNNMTFGEHSTSDIAELKIIADTAHDSVFYFGDNADNVRAGIYYDVSENTLQFRGYNNTTRLIISSTGNIGIGTTPTTSARLDIASTTGALLIPRMTTTQRDALTAVNGMLLYNSTLNKFQGYENSAWVDLV